MTPTSPNTEITRGSEVLDKMGYREHRTWRTKVGSSSSGLVRTSKIFYAKSKVCPKGWSFDHVGFILEDGKLLQMSGHRFGEGAYLLNSIEEDPMFPMQKLEIQPIGTTITINLKEDTNQLQNCGMYVQAMLLKNGKKKSLEDIYAVMRKKIKG